MQAQNVLPSKQLENVKVLLAKDASEALVEVSGPYYIFNPKDHSRITSGLLGKRFLVRSTAQGIKWGETFLDIHQISIVPRSEDSSLLINGVQYDGAISVFGNNGKIHVVNELSIEKFVRSILNKEFFNALPREVMSALAILCRTNTSFRALNEGAFWHLDANAIGYVGAFLHTPKSLVDKVISATKGLILVNKKNGTNLPFPATWTEHSAGATAAFSAIFRKNIANDLQGVVSQYALQDRPEVRWQCSITKEDLAARCGLNDITSIELFIDPSSKKSYAARLRSTSECKDLSFFELQHLIGKDLLQSNDLSVAQEASYFIFNGYGKGHGVGLCLYSATMMASQGKNALTILQQFYPDTALYNISNMPQTPLLQPL